MLKIQVKNRNEKNNNITGVINDPLGQAHRLANNERCFRLQFVL